MELRVGGKYRLGRKIGSGSFGDIYLGEWGEMISGTGRGGKGERGSRWEVGREESDCQSGICACTLCTCVFGVCSLIWVPHPILCQVSEEAPGMALT